MSVGEVLTIIFFLVIFLIPVAERVGMDSNGAMDCLEANLQALGHMTERNAAEAELEHRVNELLAQLLRGLQPDCGPETRTLDQRGVIAALARSVEARGFQGCEAQPVTAWQPVTALEAQYLSEAVALRCERNEARFEANRYRQVLQVLDGCNRVLQHLLRNARRGHGPPTQGPLCPRRWWRRRCTLRAKRAVRPKRKYTIRARDPLLIALEVQERHALPAPKCRCWESIGGVLVDEVTFTDDEPPEDEATGHGLRCPFASVSDIYRLIMTAPVSAADRDARTTRS